MLGHSNSLVRQKPRVLRKVLRTLHALLIDEHHILDATEVIRQNIWLNLPMYPSCNWEGVGECPNLIAQRVALEEQEVPSAGETEAIIPDGVDPRWAALLRLQQSSDEG